MSNTYSKHFITVHRFCSLGGSTVLIVQVGDCQKEVFSLLRPERWTIQAQNKQIILIYKYFKRTRVYLMFQYLKNVKDNGLQYLIEALLDQQNLG